MRTSRALVGLIVAVLLVAAAAWVGTRDRAEKVVSSLLFPGLAEHVAEVERVRVFAAGDVPALDLIRSGDRWSVTDRDGYPADVGKIGVLLDDVAALRIVEAKTTDPARYVDLGVEDVSASSASGVRLLVTGSGGTELANLIVGNRSSTPEGTYVRKTGEAASWLVNRLPLARSPGAWISPLVFHVDTDRIHEATFRPTGKAPFTATKAERTTENFTVTGRPLSKPSAANGIAAGLIAIEADDVQRSSMLAGLPVAARATYRMFDGLELELTGWEKDGVRWITVEPSFNDALSRRYANDKPPADGSPFWRTPDQARQEAQRLAERVNGWAYRIAPFRYDGLFPDADAWR
jgi:hypothetical protein